MPEPPSRPGQPFPRRDWLKLALAGVAGSALPAAARPPLPRPAAPIPPTFTWGAATSSYQVEGAAAEDGRGPSIWDTFCRVPGHIADGSDGSVAADQYHRFPEDIRLLRELGLGAYRFSLSWSRILPEGTGRVNQAGLDYYRRLVDELLAQGIQPWATLFHWDLPQALQDRFQGWQSKACAQAFGDFAALAADALSDRVARFFTVNELGCFTDLGHGSGVHAPGLRLPARALNQVRHHGCLAHGLAVQALRARARSPIQVGLADNPQVCVPALETPRHIAAARTAMRVLNAPFLTALMEGAYLDSYLESQGADAPAFTPGEMRAIGSPLDFVGLNMYAPTYIQASDASPGFRAIPFPASYPRMDVDWLKVGPGIAYWGPRHLHDLWKMPTVISENGCCCQDASTDGAILDTDRVFYLREHLASVRRAVAEGIPLTGYFVWSLLDNFEWGEGYRKRFGIVHVDFQTQRRTPKLSAEFLRETALGRQA